MIMGRGNSVLTSLVLLAVAAFGTSSSVLGASSGPAAVSFLVTGRFEYEDKAWDAMGWTGIDPILAIRSADVVVMDAARDKVIGRGMTDNQGEFSIVCKSKQPTVDLLVRVDSESRTRAKVQKNFPRLKVVNPNRVVYSAFAPMEPGHPVGSDVDVGTTTVLKTVAAGKEGNPFNVFDMAVGAFEYVTAPEVGMSRKVRTLRVTWPSPAGSFSIGRRAWVGTHDGYDDSVILHEVGHLVHNVYSDSDNPGGAHFFGDSDQDLRLAFGEGWATAFAGIVSARLGMPAMYVDSNASAQVDGAQLILDLESAAPFETEAAGAGDEIAVACVLFDLLDSSSEGDGPSDDDGMAAPAQVDGLSPTEAWWDVFVGPMRRTSRVNVNHAWDAWLTRYAQPEYGKLVDVFEDRQMDFWDDDFEPDNSPSTSQAVSAMAYGSWSADHTLYSAGAGNPGPGTGDRDWYSIQLKAGQSVEIETRYPDGITDAGTQVDPFLALFDPSGKLVAKDDDSGYRRNALVQLGSAKTAGTWRFLVRSRNKLNRYGRYNVRVLVDN